MQVNIFERDGVIEYCFFLFFVHCFYCLILLVYLEMASIATMGPSQESRVSGTLPKLSLFFSGRALDPSAS